MMEREGRRFCCFLFLRRDKVHRVLSAAGIPEFGTVLKVLVSLNIKLIAQPGGA